MQPNHPIDEMSNKLHRSATLHAKHDARMIHLVGPGAAGKSTAGALLGERLGIPFVDLDEQFMVKMGDIGTYIREYGYLAYAARNVELYSQIVSTLSVDIVIALSSGFLTYPSEVEPSYARHRERIVTSERTVVLLPSLDFEKCVAEIVRRQMLRSFSRSATREEEVIRERFPLYANLPAQKVETMRPCQVVIDEVIALLN